MTLDFIEDQKEKIRVRVETFQQEPTQLIQFQSVPLSVTTLLVFSPVVTFLLYSTMYLSYTNVNHRYSQSNVFPNFGIVGDISSCFQVLEFDQFLKGVIWAVFLFFPLLLISCAVLFDYKIYEFETWWTLDNLFGRHELNWLSSTGQRFSLGAIVALLTYLGTLVLMFRISSDNLRSFRDRPSQASSMLLFLATFSMSIIYAFHTPEIAYSKFYSVLGATSTQSYLGEVLSYVRTMPMGHGYVAINLGAAAVAMSRGSIFLSSTVLFLQALPIIFTTSYILGDLTWPL